MPDYSDIEAYFKKEGFVDVTILSKKIRATCTKCNDQPEFEAKYWRKKMKKGEGACRNCSSASFKYSINDIKEKAEKCGWELLDKDKIPRNVTEKIAVQCKNTDCQYLTSIQIRALMEESHKGCEHSYKPRETIQTLLKDNNLVFKTIKTENWIAIGSRTDFICLKCNNSYPKKVEKVIQTDYACEYCVGKIRIKESKDFLEQNDFKITSNNLPENLKTNFPIEYACKTHEEYKVTTDYNHLISNLQKKGNAPLQCIYCRRDEYLKRLREKAKRECGIIIHANSIEAIKSKQPKKVADYQKEKVQYTCIDHGHTSESTAHTIFADGTGCNRCKGPKNEELTRKILDHYFNTRFEKEKKVKIGKEAYEFDGVSNKLAFEYQGEQHTQYLPYFHKDKAEYEKIQERDKARKDFWKGNGKYLFAIEYFREKSQKEIYKRISDSFNAVKFTFDEKKLKESIKEVLK